MSRKGRRTTGRDGQVLARELARIISHIRRAAGGSPRDGEIADALLDRFTIIPKGVGASTPQPEQDTP